MNDEVIWQAFTATGDPRFYLMYKQREPERGKNEKTDRQGSDTPVPED